MEPPQKRAPLPSVDGAGGLASIALTRGLLKPEQIKTCSISKGGVDAEAARMEFGKSVLEHGYLTVDQLGSLIRDVRRKVAPCPGCRKDLNIEDCAAGTPIICDGCGQLLNVPASFETPKVESATAAAEGPKLLANRYEFVSELGAGGMGMVYQAIDRSLRRTVALKLLRSEMAHDSRAISRFEAEARAAARLSHPNIISVHDMGASPDGFYIAMDYVPSGSFRDAMNRRESLKSKVATLAKVAHAVAYAHSKGVVHRDLKPENILIDARAEPVVTDFGLAKVKDSEMQMTRQGLQIGTPLYMSPEQAKGDVQAIDARTDVYALGVILYEILTGQPPHLAEDLQELYHRIILEDPARPSSVAPRVPYDLELIAMKALERERHHRYAGAAMFAAELDRWLAGEPIQTRPATTLRRIARRVARNRYPVIVAISVIAVGLVVMTIVRQERVKRDEDARLRTLEKDKEDQAERHYEAAVTEFNRIESNPSFRHREILEGCARILSNLNGAIALRSADRYYALRGRTLVRIGRNDEALRDAEKVIAMSPDAVEGYLLRSEVRLLALDAITGAEIMMLDPHEFHTTEDIPFSERETKLLGEIEADLTRAQKIAGARPMPAIKSRMFHMEAVRLSKRHEWPGVLTAIQAAVDLDPGNGTLWTFLALAQQELQKYPEALESAKRARALAPRSPKCAAHFLEIQDLMLCQREDRGEDVIEERKRNLRASDAIFGEVDHLDLNLLVRRAELVISLASDTPRGEMVEDLKKVLELMTIFEQGESRNPYALKAKGETLLRLATSIEDPHAAEEAFFGARKVLQLARELSPENSLFTAITLGLLAESNYRLGILLEKSGGDGSAYFRESIEEGEMCFARMPKNWQCLEIVSWSYCALGRKKEGAASLTPAIAALTRLIQEAPAFKVIALSRRWEAYFRLGKYEEALADLERLKGSYDADKLDRWTADVKKAQLGK